MNLDQIETAAKRHASDLHWEGADIAYQTHVTPDVVVKLCGLIRKQEAELAKRQSTTNDEQAYAWRKVCAALDACVPSWLHRD